MQPSEIRVSVIIPTFNEERNIGRTLRSIFTQSKLVAYGEQVKGFSLEIIVIDSGSTDRTVDIVRRFARKHGLVHLYTVRRFHHSIVRNVAAKVASGNILVFLNADASPANEEWLPELIRPILLGYAASFSRQIPPRHIVSIDCAMCLAGFPPNDMIIDAKNYRLVFARYGVLLSTVSCAVCREVFEDLGGFNPRVPVNEDQEFALRLIMRGHKIYYASRSVVIHAHSLSLRGVFRRYRAYGEGWKAIHRIHRSQRLGYSPRLAVDVISILLGKGRREAQWSPRLLLQAFVAAIAFLVGRYVS